MSIDKLKCGYSGRGKEDWLISFWSQANKFLNLIPKARTMLMWKGEHSVIFRKVWNQPHQKSVPIKNYNKLPTSQQKY